MTSKTMWIVLALAFSPAACLAGGGPGEDCVTGGFDTAVHHGVAKLCVTTSQEAAPKNGWRWGSEFSPPRVRPISLSILIDGETIFVPVSSYADLGNPRDLTMSASEDFFEIVIKGGDAAVAYTAKLRIKGLFVRERAVTNNEFSAEATEKSVYSYNESLN